MNLKSKYHFFMRSKIDQKYFKNFKHVEVLGERFVGKYYVVIFQASNYMKGYKEDIYVIVENIKKPVLVKLETEAHADKYIVFLKNALRSKIPKGLYKRLAKNGLYGSVENGMKLDNTRFGLARLVACLYHNILGLEVHHIYKDVSLNSISSLVPVSREVHIRLDNLPLEKGIQQSQLLQENLLRKSLKPRITLASNDAVILEVLSLRQHDGNRKSIIKKFKKRIGQTKIYEYLGFFFYYSEFQNLLEMSSDEKPQRFNELSFEYWQKVFKYEYIITSLKYAEIEVNNRMPKKVFDIESAKNAILVGA